MVRIGFIFHLVMLVFINIAWANPVNFVYQGQITKPNGQLLEEASVTFTVEILSPGAEACVLYEETHTLNMIGTNGIFSLEVGSGVRSGVDYEDTTPLALAFDNSLSTVFPDRCGSGGSYTPTAVDSRKLRMTFDHGSGPVTVTDNHNIVSTPFAISSARLNGLEAGDFVQINTSGATVLSQANLENIFTNTSFTELQALIAGSSSQYLTASPSANVDMNSQRIINVDDPSAGTDATNKNYVDAQVGGRTLDTATVSGIGVTESGHVLTWTGSQWTSQAPSGDSTKLPRDGSAAMTGNLNLGNNNITGANDITAAGDVSITGGIGVGTGINSSGTISLEDQNILRFGDSNSSTANQFYVGFRAPSTVVADVTWTLPGADGASGEVLTTNGAGLLSWAPAAGADHLGNHTATTDLDLANNSIINLEGGSAIAPSISFNGDSNTGIFSAASDNLSLTTAGTERLTIANDGDVGIGTTTPGYSLHVYQPTGGVDIQADTDASGSDAEVSVRAGSRQGGMTMYGSTHATRSNIFEIGTESTGGLGEVAILSGNGAEQVRIDASGEVGIGTSTPHMNLHIDGGTTTGARILLSNDTSVSGTQSINFMTSDDGNAPWNASQTGWHMFARNSSFSTVPEQNDFGLAYWNGASWDPRLFIEYDSGNVGIGTTAPSGKLDVEGGDVFIGAATQSNASGNEDLIVTGNVEVGGVIYGDGSGLTNITAGSASAGTSATNYVINTDSDNAGSDGGLEIQTNGTAVATISSTGTISGSAGSIATPGLSFLGDTDTGLTAPAANTVSLSAGGVEGLRVNTVASGVNYVELTPASAGNSPILGTGGSDTNIDLTLAPKGSGNTVIANGNLGIGTTAPAATLDVAGSINATSRVQVEGFSGGTVRGLIVNNTHTGTSAPNSAINLQTGTTGLDRAIIQAGPDGASTSGYLSLYTRQGGAMSEVMRLDSSGNVGIGTTAPLSKLDVEGRIISAAKGIGATDGGSIIFEELSTSTDDVVDGVPEHVGFRAPQSVAADIVWELPAADGSAGQLLQTNGSGVLSWATLNNIQDADGDTNIQMEASADEDIIRMNVATNEMLTLRQGSLPGAAVGNGVHITRLSNDSRLFIKNGSSSGGESSLIFGHNWGTTNYAKVGSDGGDPLHDHSLKLLTFGDRDITFAPNSSEMMRIEGSTGNIGIGTTTPSGILDVEGGDVFIGTATQSNASVNEDLIVTGNVEVGGVIYGDGSGITNITAGSSGAGTSATNYVINTDSDNAGSDGGLEIQTNGSAVATISSTGTISGSAGSIATPGLSFLGDTDTGLTAPAANTVSLSAGGVEGLRVNTVASGVNYVELTPASAGNSPILGTGGSDTNIDLTLAPKGSGNTVIANGNLGIGTTAPSEKLEVVGTTATTGLSVNGGVVSGNTILASTLGRISHSWNGGSSTMTLINDNASNNSTAPILAVKRSRFGVTSDIQADFGGEINLDLEGATNATVANAALLTWAWENAQTNDTTDRDAYLSFSTAEDNTLAERMRINSSGNVGIGTTAPTSKLEVNGAIRNTSSTLNASATIDFATGNIQHTSSSCGAFTFHNLKDGGTYNFIVKGTTSATCVFTAFSDTGSTPVTVHYPAGHTATTAGEHTVYSIMVAGTDAYLAWVTAFD